MMIMFIFIICCQISGYLLDNYNYPVRDYDLKGGGNPMKCLLI